MTLTIQVNGQNYENFISAEVTRSIRAGSGSFQFDTSAGSDQGLPVKPGDLVKILADGEPVVTGYVDSLDVNYSSNSHSISVAGRDKTQDIIDSSVKTKKEFVGNVTLRSVIESVISDLGADIQVVDQTDGIDPFDEDEITSAEIGQSAFEFFEAFARKRQILLTTDGSGNLALVRGAETPSGLILVNNAQDPGRINNVLSSKLSVDVSRRYNTYRIQSQGNPTFSLSNDTAEQLTEISGDAVDSSVRTSRFLEFQGEESLKPTDAGKRSQWEANLRRANSVKYTAMVQGHSLDGQLWDFNQIVNVKDDFTDTEATMLITDVRYSYDLQNGSTTEITLTLPDAFRIQAELDQLTANTEKVGGVFTL